MSDADVAAALRSSAGLVVVEAPGGCGKTFQGAKYAVDAADALNAGRVLILAHTNAACDVFAERTRRLGNRIEIRTIDSLICQIASAYHRALGLPQDPAAWARCTRNGYAVIAELVCRLLESVPIVVRALCHRYPVVICDEYQDASAAQHGVVMALHRAGARVRIFGDPVQQIYGASGKEERASDGHRWNDLKAQADASAALDTPHRWMNGARELGEWILRVRHELRSGGTVNLRDTPPTGLSVVFADNSSPAHGRFMVDKLEREPIYTGLRPGDPLMVLAAHNDTVEGLHSFFGRQMPIWEGHTRERLDELVIAIQTTTGRAPELAAAALTFLTKVTTGFTSSGFKKPILDEVKVRCTPPRRGKPAILQSLARIIIEQPDHKGVARLIKRVHELTSHAPEFRGIQINYRQEFWDAVRLGEYDDVGSGLMALASKRSACRPMPPAKSISTVHKAKGLETDNVILLPCDRAHFPDSTRARRILYVALSRPRKRLTLVLSRKQPSPIISI